MKDQPHDPVDDGPRRQDGQNLFRDDFGNIERPNTQPQGGYNFGGDLRNTERHPDQGSWNQRDTGFPHSFQQQG